MRKKINEWAQRKVSVAVATGNGLVTPVVRAVNQMNLNQLSAATEDLIARARVGRLKQNEIESGTISVTNLGMYRTVEVFAILNPSQSAILSVGASSHCWSLCRPAVGGLHQPFREPNVLGALTISSHKIGVSSAN